MKKLTTLLLALLLLLALSAAAAAEKTDWYDKSYDFTKVKRALIYDVTLTDRAEFDSDLLDRVLQEEYLKNAQRPKYEAVSLEQAIRRISLAEGTNLDTLWQQDKAKAEEIFSRCLPQVADVYIKAELLKWHDDFHIVPQYTSWETKTITRTHKNKDGSTYTTKDYITVPVVHPPRRVDTSTVRLRFDVYDSATGKLVMSRDELRLRDDSTHGEKGIFGRICKSFFDDFKSKLKG